LDIDIAHDLVTFPGDDTVVRRNMARNEDTRQCDSPAALGLATTGLAPIPLDLAFKVLGEVLLPRNNPNCCRTHGNRFKFPDVLPAMPPAVHNLGEDQPRSRLRVSPRIPTAHARWRDVIAKTNCLAGLERPRVGLPLLKGERWKDTALHCRELRKTKRFS
jgi:hypothetical protein